MKGRMQNLFRHLCTLVSALVLFAACGGYGNRTAPVPSMESVRGAPGMVQEIGLPAILSDLESLPTPEGVEVGLFEQLKDALKEALTEGEVSKFTSAPPTTETSRVNDLGVTDNGDGSFHLTWHYRNTGDYDQNSVVGIADITPLAVLFRQEVPPGDDNSLAAVVDGNGDSVIDIKDITPLAANFMVDCAEYAIEVATDAGGDYVEAGRVPFSAGVGPGRLLFASDFTTAGYSYVRVVPYDSSGAAGIPSNVAGLPGSPPAISEVSPLAGLTEAEVEFNAEVAGDEPLVYSWDFGGGAIPNISSEANPTVTLAEPAEYNASVTVSNVFGNDTSGFTFTVYGAPQVISVSPVNASKLRVVTFVADVVGFANSYEWDFGGGAWPNSSTEKSPTVVAGLEGEYQVTLNVSNDFAGSQHQFTFSISTGSVENGDWWTELHDLRRTGRTDAAVGPAFPKVKWSRSLDGDASPMVFDAGGNVYYGDTQGFLFKVSPDGHEPWIWMLDAPLTSGSAPLINVAGSVYWGTREHLYGMTPTGNIFADAGPWDYDGLASSPDGTVYYASERSYLRAFHPDGSEFWFVQLDSGNIVNAPAVADDDTIYVGSFDAFTLYSIAPGGTVNWEFPTGDRLRGAPSIGDDGTIYVGSEDGYVYAVNPDGSQKWAHEMSHGYPHSSVTIASDGALYVCAQGLFALDPETGNELWWWPRAGIYNEYGIAPGPVIDADGTIYIAGVFGSLSAFNPDGSKKWAWTPESGDVRKEMALGPDGTLYVCTEDALYALENDPSPPLPDPPAIEGVTPTSGKQGQNVTFSATLTSGADPLYYYWEFGGAGDDQHSSNAEPDLLLLSPGTYDMALWVENEFGSAHYEFAFTVEEDDRWMVPVTIHAANNMQTTELDVAEVGGWPAIAYFDDRNDRSHFVKASDGSGDIWGSPVDLVTQFGDLYRQLSLQEFGGRPALAMRSDYMSRVYYSRSADAEGTSWNAPVRVNDAGTSPHLMDAGGLPVVTYCNDTGLNVRVATDLDGSSWGEEVSIDTESGFGSLCVFAAVNGSPALAYAAYDGFQHLVRYTHMVGGDGTSWTSPADIYPTDPFSLSLSEVNGRPAIAYYIKGYEGRGIYYLRADDAEGTSWGTPEMIVDGADFGSTEAVDVELSSLRGYPALLFRGGTYPRLMEALDQDGTAWGAPQALPTTNFFGFHLEDRGGKAWLFYGADEKLSLMRER